jgi:galactose mutarotase-like enzyme
VAARSQTRPAQQGAKSISDFDRATSSRLDAGTQRSGYSRVVTTRYEVRRTGETLETHVLHDAGTDARVTLAPSRGGMVTRFAVGSDEVLFLDEASLRDPAKNVRGGIPVLFPIAGRLAGDAYTVGGRRIEMKQHGFARNLPWTVARESTGDGAAIALELRATDATRALYPFEFVATFTYVLRDGELSVRQRFANVGTQSMPIQPGLHPYFVVDDARKSEARVSTDARTARDNRTGQRVTLGASIDFTASEVDLHLLDHTPRSTTLTRSPRREVALSFSDDQKVLVVWTLAGRDFICVEPWSAPANSLNDGGAIEVPPGGAHESFLTISVRS